MNLVDAFYKLPFKARTILFIPLLPFLIFLLSIIPDVEDYEY